MGFLNTKPMHADFHAPLIASANLSLVGLSVLVAKIVPHLATIAVLLQIAVGAVSLWQMLKKKKAPTNEKTNPTDPPSI